MQGKKRFIEKLTKKEKRSLEKAYETGKNPLFRRKCHCILLSHEGKTIKELCDLYGVCRQSLYTWLNRWESGGLKALKLNPGRGRPAKTRIRGQNKLELV